MRRAPPGSGSLQAPRRGVRSPRPPPLRPTAEARRERTQAVRRIRRCGPRHPGGPLLHRREDRRGRRGHCLPRARPRARARRRPQDAAQRLRRGARQRPAAEGSQSRIAPVASLHRADLRGVRARGTAVVRDGPCRGLHPAGRAAAARRAAVRGCGAVRRDARRRPPRGPRQAGAAPRRDAREHLHHARQPAAPRRLRHGARAARPGRVTPSPSPPSRPPARSATCRRSR